MFLASVGQIATLLHTLGTFETLKAIEFLQLIIFAHCNVYPSSLKFSYCMLHIVCACPNNDTPTLVQHESYLPLRFELYHLQCSANCLKDFDPLFFSYCISFPVNMMGTRQFTDKTDHRNGFRRQFNDRFEGSSPTLLSLTIDH